MMKCLEAEVSCVSHVRYFLFPTFHVSN
jgi:hypothetical protein